MHVVCRVCHQSLVENVSKQSAGDRVNSRRCSSGNKHIRPWWVSVTRNVLPGSVVLSTLRCVRACTLIGVVVSACIRRCMRSSVREFMTAATHAAATSKLQPELKMTLELMY